MTHGDAREGKWRGNWRIGWVDSTLHTTSEHGVSSITTADAHTSAVSSQLKWRPRRFKWTPPFRRKTKNGFCAFAITFQTQSTISSTPALDGVGGQGHSPVALSPEIYRYPLYRRLRWPQDQSGRELKMSSTLRFDHRTVQPTAFRYTGWAVPVRISALVQKRKSEVVEPLLCNGFEKQNYCGFVCEECSPEELTLSKTNSPVGTNVK
jgi:hypothetical protein